MDPKARFSATAADYRLHRPTYPEALLAWLRAQFPSPSAPPRAVDLAAGTGIFTRQLAAAGFDVVGVEPNAEMRAAATPDTPPLVTGSAEATGLPDHSAALVTAAQAFHWFDLPAALREIDRLLVPDGLAAAVWNVRACTPFNDAYEALLLDASSTYRAVARADDTLATLVSARPGGVRLQFAHAQHLDAAGLHGRAWSSSYVQHGVADAAAFDRALSALFAAHATTGVLTLAYETVGWAWRRRP